MHIILVSSVILLIQFSVQMIYWLEIASGQS